MKIEEVVALLDEKGIRYGELHQPLEENRQIIISDTCDLLENEYSYGWVYSIRGGAAVNYQWTEFTNIRTTERLSELLDKHHVRHGEQK